MEYNSEELMRFVESQTTILNRKANESAFPEIVYPDLVPISVEGNPFAESVTYISSSQVGKAGWIHGDSDDIPMADVGLKAEVKPVYTAAIGYGFGWEELARANQVLEQPLDALKAVAARRAYEQMVNRIVLKGDKEKGFLGLSNASMWQNEGGASLSNWTSSSTTDEAITTEINRVLMKTANSGGIPTANTLLVPVAYFTALFSRYIPNARDSLLDYTLRGNIYTAMTGQPLTIRAVAALDGNSASSGNMIVAYKRDPDTLVLHIPMPHRFLPVHQAGPLRWEVPGVFRLGGLNVRSKENTAKLSN